MQGSQHNQPILPYTQQLLSYNIQYPNTNEELAQDNPSSVYPPLGDDIASNSLPYGRWVIQQAQDDPLSVYPPLDHQNVSNSPPYGRWVIQQAQQNFPPPILNSYSVNAGYPMNSSYQPDNTQTDTSQNSTRKSEEPVAHRKVSMNRAAKQRKDPACDPRLVYPDPETRAPWGSKICEDGQHLFSYTDKGQWRRDRHFNNEQLREYVDNCPKGTVFRVQQAPTQCNGRMDPEDRMCRWANCPVSNRTITSGWLRVCFDEFPVKTSGGKRDPLKCAGSMHLWCFEQVFDPVEFDLDGRLKAETRHFPREERNVTALEKLTDVGIVRIAYEGWFKERKEYFNEHGNFPVSQKYNDTLSFALNKFHIEHQTDARQRARENRYKDKKNKGGPQRTIDVHEGNLQMYVTLTTMAKEMKRVNRQQETGEGEDLPGDDLDFPDASSEMRTAPPPTLKAKKAENHERIASNLPAGPYLETSSSHLLQTQQRSSRGSDRKGTSARRLRKEFRRRVLAPQPPVDRGHNLSTNTCSSSTETVDWNTNSTPSCSFGPLNPACSTLQSTLRPSLKIRVPSNHHQSSLANAYNSIYPQAIPGSSFSLKDPMQPGHFLGPPSWQCQQQQLFSNTAACPYVKMEQQPVILDDNLNTPLETSQGNNLVEFCQSETKALAQKAGEEAPQVLGDSDGTSSNDSNQVKGLGPEETNLFHFLIVDEDVPETTQYPAEGSTEAMDNFIAQTQMSAATSQPLELVACTESPQVAAVAEPWHSVGSFMDPVNYGGYSNTDIFSLFDDSAVTVDGP